MSKMIHLFGVAAGEHPTIPEKIVGTSVAVAASPKIIEQIDKWSELSAKLRYIPITPLAECFVEVDKQLEKGDVIVLASGDPMFFGISRRLAEHFGGRDVRIYPAVSSMQYACSAFGIPWDDMAFISVHGREGDIPLGQILSYDKVLLLTDSIRRPEVIASTLSDFLGAERSSSYRTYVAENIGSADERFVESGLDEIAGYSFGGMCCMVLVREGGQPDSRFLGLTENDIIHSRGLITKNEVRACALHALALPENGVFWDVGAGSGSVSVEAARLRPGLLVYSLDKELEQIENIESNIRKYKLFNVKSLHGGAPESLESFPSPDRVFIGGSGGNLAEIVAYCSEKLQSDGRIVISAVLQKTRDVAPELLHRHGLCVEIKNISFSRNEYPGGEEKRFNPITLIVGRKVSS